MDGHPTTVVRALPRGAAGVTCRTCGETSVWQQIFEDISELERVGFVMKGGAVVKDALSIRR